MKKKSGVPCPKCGERIAAMVLIPDEQRMSLELTRDQQCPWLSADTIGGVLTNTDKLLKAVAKDIGGKVSVFVSGIAVTESGMKIDLVITTVQKKAKGEGR